jgi:tetratricopeptide (TPR) repeat protein
MLALVFAWSDHGGMADIFVSYTSSDRDWAFWIAMALKKLGHRAHIHEWEINAGDDIYAWTEARQDAADHVLCVVSDDYLKAPYSTLERNAALWQAASKRPGFVLLVVVKQCRLPTLSDHMRRCDLFDLPEEAARQRLRAFLETRSAPSIVPFPGKVVAVSNIPIRVPTHFLGRDDALAAIEAALGRYEGRVAITALHGLRGVGKTTLAAAYAERYRGDYRATWWIRAQSEPTMRGDLVALGVRLSWVSLDEKEAPALAVVTERLRHEGDGILLIFDNATDADALKPYLPPGGAARILVTSNAPAWRSVAEQVEIRLWPKEIGADYLVARTGREGERKSAEALSETLGGLPLAHEQAAAYCERLEIPLAEYGRRFAAAPVQMLDARRDAPAEYHDKLTVAKTFALAIEEAAKLHPAAEPLLVRAALLAPEPIPLFLFAEGREKFGEPLASALASDGLDEAVATLRAFALVDHETIVDERDPAVSTDTMRLHRLVREIAAARCASPSREAATGALAEAIAAIYPKDGYENSSSWPYCAHLTPHVLHLTRSRGEFRSIRSSLLNVVGMYLLGRGAFEQAAKMLREALAIRERALDTEPADVATSLSNLALLMHYQNDLAGARVLCERALAIREEVLDSDHPDTAISLNNLASLLQDQGDLEGARPLYERALAVSEKVFGPEHFETATQLDNLGVLFKHLGRLMEARGLLERALAIREKALGPNHSDTALSLNNLALLFLALGDLEAAQPLCERALAIDEQALGSEHPETADCLNTVALVLQSRGDRSAAQLLFERALSMRERVLGSDHPDTAAVRKNLALLSERSA